MENQVEKISNLFNTITPWVVVEILVGCLIAWLIIKIAAKMLPLLAELLPVGLRQGTLNVIPILRVFVLVILILWAIPLIFNVTLQNFVLIAGALSVAIGFALKDLSSAIIAGLIALAEKPYRLGDWVKVGEHYGEVISVGMRAFQIRTPDDDVVTIPHDRIWSENIVNSNNGESTLMCMANFHLAREQDTTAVRDILTDVAKSSAYLNLDRDVIVVMKNTEIGLHYQLKAYPFEPRDQFVFISDLTERGNAALRAADLTSTAFPADLAQ